MQPWQEFTSIADVPKLTTTDHLRLVTRERQTDRLTVPEAAAYVGCKTVGAFYTWRKRRFLKRKKVYTRAELDAVLRTDERRRELAKRTRRMHPASLANLRRRAS